MLKKELHRQFFNTRFLMCLSFLVDNFESVNSVNLALQGKDINVVHCHEKMTSFKMKLHLWDSKLNFAPFPNFNTLLGEDGLRVDAEILEIMKRYVLILHAEIQRYFSDVQNVEKAHYFNSNAFAIFVVDFPSGDCVIQEQFINLLNDGSAKKPPSITCVAVNSGLKRCSPIQMSPNWTSNSSFHLQQRTNDSRIL
ncbi:Hypothetical predicted protein [Octopus vulgaris]|uniref:Uncharacterized protein n=1 Tax=Octopus vulgaris TaxID=6645 RepID=A0AA36AQ50_OCTVU|nr:Hypothetical predicted protein [Octopus vulgaris]